MQVQYIIHLVDADIYHIERNNGEHFQLLHKNRRLSQLYFLNGDHNS